MSGAMFSRRRTLSGFRCLLLLACGWIFGLSSVASATVLVEGNRSDLRVMSENESIANVLAAVSVTLNLKVRSAIPLETASNKVYLGSFASVIAQLLSGYNYVIRYDDGATEVIVLGKRGAAPVAPEPPKKSEPKGIASRWR